MVVLWLIVAVLVLVALVGAGLAIFTYWTAKKVEAVVPRPGRMINADGVNLHYVEEGSGPPIVMIHGLASQMQTYTYAVSALLRDRYRLIMVDRPGSGYSEAAAEATLSAQAATIDAFLRALGIYRALVVGHSLGGAVALSLALDHPERVAGLALLGPLTQTQDTPPEALRSLAVRSDFMRRLIGWTLATPFGILNRNKTLPQLFGPDPVPSDFGTRGGSLLVMRPWTYRNASRDLASSVGELPGYARRYGELAMPVGILFGRDDRILDYTSNATRIQAQVPHLHLDTIDNAGHMVPLSHPERTAAFIETMAQKCGLDQSAVSEAGAALHIPE